MDPISLIIAALVAGASTAASETASAAIKDAYEGLKSLVRRRFDGRHDALAELERAEHEPESEHARLADHLRDVDASEDEALLDAARRLLATARGPEGHTTSVTISGGKGIVVGPHATTTMTFGERE